MRLREKTPHIGQPMRLLVVTAVAAEAEAICDGLGAGAGDRITVIAGGVGPAAAAASTARALVLAAERGMPYAVVISAGIAGGFSERVDVGATVLATATVAADLGAETPDGFLSVAELDFGQSTMECDAETLAALREAFPDAVAGTVLTVVDRDRHRRAGGAAPRAAPGRGGRGDGGLRRGHGRATVRRPLRRTADDLQPDRSPRPRGLAHRGRARRVEARRCEPG